MPEDKPQITRIFANRMEKILYKEQCYTILGACFEVYNVTGPGFLESVYQEALEIEFATRGIPYKSQDRISIHYKGKELRSSFVSDFRCFDHIIVEIKATKALGDAHRAQLMNYLRLTTSPLGLLINFGAYPDLEHLRMANTRLA